MPRNPELISARNKQIRRTYERLISEESIVVVKGAKVVVRLNYQQVVTVLGAIFYLSPRTIEPIITAEAPKMALSKSVQPTHSVPA